MTSMPVPSADDLRARLLARLDEIRRTLDRTAATVKLSDDQQGEYRRVVAALDALEHQVREILGE